MLKIQFAKKVDTTVQIVQKGLKPESEKKKKYDYSTEELALENALSYKENAQNILSKLNLK